MHPATTAGAAGPPIQNPAATSTDYNPRFYNLLSIFRVSFPVRAVSESCFKT